MVNAMQGVGSHASSQLSRGSQPPPPPPPPPLHMNDGNHNPDKDLRKTILPIFYELIAELQAEGPDFRQIQSKLVDKLDAAVFEHKCDQEFRQLFRTL
jgi:hypothetical protein